MEHARHGLIDVVTQFIVSRGKGSQTQTPIYIFSDALYDFGFSWLVFIYVCRYDYLYFLYHIFVSIIDDFFWMVWAMTPANENLEKNII